MEKIVLIGGGGHCKVVIDMIKLGERFEIVGIIDKEKGQVMGVPIIGDDEILEKLFNEGVRKAFVCVGGISNPRIREKLYLNLKKIGYSLPVIIHPHSIISDSVSIGEGTCVMAGAVLNAGCKVGENCIINTRALVEHDANLDKNVHVSPGAIVLGDVTVGKNSLIGAGTVIKQGISVGENTIVGAGSVVVKDIAEGSKAYGVPAKVVKSL